MAIEIGTHKILKIRYDEIQPGDFLCTYEALTTRADLLFLETILKCANPCRPKELNKMFHAEVIIDKYPHLGLYKIAHADGSCKKIRSQYDNLKDHHPGQAFIIFRAREKAIQKEIVAISKKTSEENNGHICATTHFEFLSNRIQYIFNYFLFDHSRNFASNQTLKKLISILSNYNETGKFYSHSGTGSKTMSCIEYVANIINIATLRVFIESSQIEKSKIPNEIDVMNKSGDFPFKFSHPHASPASFVEFFLKHPKHFQTVGYLGSFTTPLDGPILDVKGPIIQSSPFLISKILFTNNVADSDFIYAVQVMKVLNIINDSWQIYSKTARDPAKIKTLLISIQNNINNQTLQKSFSNLEEIATEFIQRLEQFSQSKSIESVVNCLKIKDLPHNEIINILLLEKKILQSENINRTEKTLKLSLNSLTQELVRIKRLKLIANQQITLAKILSKTLILSPISLIFLTSGYVLNKFSINSEIDCKKKLNDILIVHEKIRKNGRLVLTTEKKIQGNQRIGIEYSTDSGKTWNLEYFKLEDSSWQTNLHVPKGKNILYKLIISSKNEDDQHPTSNVLEQTKLMFVHNHQLQITWENESMYLILPNCVHPVWMDKVINVRTSILYEYQERCNKIAPDEHWPNSIQAYEHAYSSLENDISSPIPEYYKEENIISNLRNFVKNEMHLKVAQDQIKVFDSGIGKGLSGDRVYQVIDNDKRCVFVIKVFMNKRGKFSREFTSLMNHENLNINSFQIPRVQGVGASKVNNERVYFLAMNYISGISLYEMFKNLTSKHSLSVEREESFKKLLSIYGKLGKALSEFHLSSHGDSLPIHPVFGDLINAFYKNALLKFEGHLNPLTIHKLKIFFVAHLPLVTKKNLVRGYHHGDINAGNIIYDFKKDCLSIIDWPDGSFSIGKQGKPLGIPFFDLIQIKNELLNRKVQGMTEDEINQLYNTFEIEYKKKGLALPSIEIINFFTVFDLMGSLKWFIDRIDTFKSNSQEYELAKMIYTEKLMKLTTLIQRPLL